MASEPFEARDANGVTVRGAVDVSRHPKGNFYNPRSQYYGKSRYAEFDIVYSDTREVCSIDRDTLRQAAEKALRNALIKFGIPDPDPAAIEERVKLKIDETRQWCVANADKYVSNETDTAIGGMPGESVGDTAVAGPGGGMRGPATRENASWASENDGRLVPNWQPDSENGANAAYRQPVRYLSSRVAGKSVPWGLGADATAPPLVSLGENFDSRQATADEGVGGWTALNSASISRGSSQPGMPLLGLVSGKPMSFQPVQPPIFGFPEQAPSGDEDWLLQLLAPRGRR